MTRSTALSARRQQGAALLLLLSLVMLGAGSLAIGAFRNDHAEQEKSLATLRRLADAREALLGFALRNGRLPRPATSPHDGRESPVPCKNEADCTGVLPWVTLGIDGIDSWGKLLRYNVTPAYTGSSINATTSVATKQIRGRDGNGTPYLKVGSAACTAQTWCAPAVVFSSGKNSLGLSAQGIALVNASLSNADELSNNDTTGPFFDHAAQADPSQPGGEYDDLLTWVPLPILYRQMSSAGTLRTINLYSAPINR